MNVSDEILGAFVDNELAAGDRAELLAEFARDAALRSRASELWQVKQLVRAAYPASQPCAVAPAPPPRRALALAATVLLTVGALTGWLVNEQIVRERQLTSQIEAIRADGGRVVLHLFSDAPARMQTALRLAEQLATTRDARGHPFRVEFIANGPGLHLLRAGGSAYAAEIERLRHHENLRIIACREAIARLEERGLAVTLLPGVEVTPSAESELAARLTQGWRYVQS